MKATDSPSLDDNLYEPPAYGAESDADDDGDDSDLDEEEREQRYAETPERLQQCFLE